MNKKQIAMFMVVLFAFVALATPVFAAGHGAGKGCPYCHGKSWKLDEKIVMKAGFLYMNQDALELDEQQVQGIKDLKHQVKKEVIRRRAEIEVMGVDIKTRLYDNPVDVEVVNQLMEQKYALKLEMKKYLVQALADLKAILTVEQYEAMKRLWWEKKG